MTTGLAVAAGIDRIGAIVQEKGALTPADPGGIAGAHLAMLAFSLLVSGSFVFGSRVAGDIAPLALTAVRFWVAAAVFGAMVAVLRGRKGLRFSARHLGMGALMGAYFSLMFVALDLTSSVNTAAIFTTLPLLSGLIDRVLNGRRLKARAWLAVTVGAAGAVLVVTRGDPGRLADIGWRSGEAFFFVGCIAHAFYVALTPRASRGEAPEVFTFGILAGGALSLALIGARDLVATDWGALPPRVFWVAAYIAIPATCISFLLMRIASLRLPAANVAAYTYLVPIWVMLAEALAGGGVPAGALAGVPLVVVALLILLIGTRARAAPA